MKRTIHLSDLKLDEIWTDIRRRIPFICTWITMKSDAERLKESGIICRANILCWMNRQPAGRT